MDNHIDNGKKKPTQPSEVMDEWVRLAMFHQRKNQGEAAVALGTTDSTLSKWRKGLVMPNTDWLLQKMVHGNEPWIRIMAYQVLQASLPEVFKDGDLCAVMVDMAKIGCLEVEEIFGVDGAEMPWS